MTKKLPGVFANKLTKELNNNEKVYYSSSKVEDIKKDIKIEKQDETTSALNINQKINRIFNSPRYIYKADVTIKLANETINKRVVGKNLTSLITIDNELIPIDSIIDIDFSN